MIKVKKYIKRIETVFVKVKNLERAVNWYKNHLDFEVKWTNEKGGAVAFYVGETDLTLVQADELTPTDDGVFNLFVEQIKPFHTLLTERGVKTTAIKDWHGISYFSFNDCDDNVIDVCSYEE